MNCGKPPNKQNIIVWKLYVKLNMKRLKPIIELNCQS